MLSYRNNRYYKKKCIYLFLFVFVNTLCEKNILFAAPKFSTTQKQQYLELNIQSKENEKIQYSSYAGFITPLKYQIKNELRYKAPTDSINKSFIVQLYNNENPLAILDDRLDFINAPSNSIATINIFNAAVIKILPLDWKSILMDNFSSKKGTKNPQNKLTVFQVEFL